MSTLELLTRRSKKTLLRDKEPKFSPRRPLDLKVMPSDPDRELNSWDSKLEPILEKNSKPEVDVVAVEVAVDVVPVKKPEPVETTKANAEVER